jgi:hypothetical protein
MIDPHPISRRILLILLIVASASVSFGADGRAIYPSATPNLTVGRFLLLIAGSDGCSAGARTSFRSSVAFLGLASGL